MYGDDGGDGDYSDGHGDDDNNDNDDDGYTPLRELIQNH